MDIEDIKPWHWLAIGLALGAIVGYVWTLPAPGRDPVMRRSLTASQFTALVEGPLGRSGRIRHLIVHPPLDGQNLVTGEIENYFNPPQFFLYADQPFKTRRGTAAPSVDAYLDAVARVNPSLHYRYGWWETTAFGTAAGAAGGALAIGGIWPILLSLLIGAGWGSEKAHEPEYDLDRFKSEPEPQSKPSTELTPSDSAHLAELEQEMAAKLTAGEPVAAKAPIEAASPPAPAPLAGGPLESLPPAPPDESKKYEGEFYPVAKPHAHHDGFSLVELLVVLGIISILISLLLPALQRARQSALVVACASNQRQIFAALQMYLNDNHGIVFWPSIEDRMNGTVDIGTQGMEWHVYGGRETGNLDLGQSGLFNAIVPRPLNRYLSNDLQAFRCPRDDAAPWTNNPIYSSYVAPSPSEFAWVGNSYNFNATGYPDSRFAGGLDGVQFGSIRDTSHTIVFYDSCATYGLDWHFLHKINVCFADSHVEFIPLPPAQGTAYLWNVPGATDNSADAGD